MYDVKCIKIHEDYMVSGYSYDIALVKLARPAIPEPGKVWPACLPSQGVRVDIGKECFITGKLYFELVVIILSLIEHACRRCVVTRFLKEGLTLSVFKSYSNVEGPRALKLNRLC